jgi:hypothetical protein
MQMEKKSDRSGKQENIQTKIVETTSLRWLFEGCQLSEQRVKQLPDGHEYSATPN